MNILGIETSCDETSAAVLRDGEVVSNVISSQLVHQRYGGVVPELASRAHQGRIVEVVRRALEEAGIGKADLHGIAATQGPGLMGALLVGLNFGKAAAYGLGIPFVGVNHLEGHLFSNFLSEDSPSFPYLSLIVSGGHTMLVKVEEPGRFRVLGQTRDDAAGEAFDKVAKMLGIGYPGGPAIDRLARDGNPDAVRFPRAYLRGSGYDFSFSGIKTAVLYYLRDAGLVRPGEKVASPEPRRLADICASFQAAVVDVLVRKTAEASREFGLRDIAVAGGVSANSALRRDLRRAMEGCRVSFPPLEYCMDNGAMIAYVGWLKMQQGKSSPLDTPAVANLELQ
ncbi:MAG: tRNA (adenosine(37)-N6)-threonylcarbamoyltransferase complex transferase subunit TsaD [Bacteroidota bacterium]